MIFHVGGKASQVHLQGFKNHTNDNAKLSMFLSMIQNAIDSHERHQLSMSYSHTIYTHRTGVFVDLLSRVYFEQWKELLFVFLSMDD